MRFVLILFLLFSTLSIANENMLFLDSSNSAEAYAQELLDMEKNAEALDFVEKARTQFTDNAKILIYGGDAAFNLGDFELAKQYYQSALNITTADAIEAIIQDHIEGGYQKEASLILEDARGLYPSNVDLLVFSGRVAYELSDLTEAKNYYLLALELDPSNEVAAASIENIKVQEEAQENKVVSSALHYIGDKGLDFLMIFLAFLGGELLAKRYLICESTGIIRGVYHYIRMTSTSADAKRLRPDCELTKKPFCSVVTIVNFLTTGAGLLIIWIFVSIKNESLTLWFGLDLTVATEDDVWGYVLGSYFVILVFLAVVSWVLTKWYENKSKDYIVLATVEKLQRVALDGQYVILRAACRLIVESHDTEKAYIADKDRVLEQCYSEEARDVIEKAFTDVITKRQKNDKDDDD